MRTTRHYFIFFCLSSFICFLNAMDTRTIVQRELNQRKEHSAPSGNQQFSQATSQQRQLYTLNKNIVTEQDRENARTVISSLNQKELANYMANAPEPLELLFCRESSIENLYFVAMEHKHLLHRSDVQERMRRENEEYLRYFLAQECNKSYVSLFSASPVQAKSNSLTIVYGDEQYSFAPLLTQHPGIKELNGQFKDGTAVRLLQWPDSSQAIQFFNQQGLCTAEGTRAHCQKGAQLGIVQHKDGTASIVEQKVGEELPRKIAVFPAKQGIEERGTKISLTEDTKDLLSQNEAVVAAESDSQQEAKKEDKQKSDQKSSPQFSSEVRALRKKQLQDIHTSRRLTSTLRNIHDRLDAHEIRRALEEQKAIAYQQAHDLFWTSNNLYDLATLYYVLKNHKPEHFEPTYGASGLSDYDQAVLARLRDVISIATPHTPDALIQLSAVLLTSPSDFADLSVEINDHLTECAQYYDKNDEDQGIKKHWLIFETVVLRMLDHKEVSLRPDQCARLESVLAHHRKAQIYNQSPEIGDFVRKTLGKDDPEAYIQATSRVEATVLERTQEVLNDNRLAFSMSRERRHALFKQAAHIVCRAIEKHAACGLHKAVSEDEKTSVLAFAHEIEGITRTNEFKQLLIEGFCPHFERIQRKINECRKEAQVIFDTYGITRSQVIELCKAYEVDNKKLLAVYQDGERRAIQTDTATLMFNYMADFSLKKYMPLLQDFANVVLDLNREGKVEEAQEVIATLAALKRVFHGVWDASTEEVFNRVRSWPTATVLGAAGALAYMHPVTAVAYTVGLLMYSTYGNYNALCQDILLFKEGWERGDYRLMGKAGTQLAFDTNGGRFYKAPKNAAERFLKTATVLKELKKMHSEKNTQQKSGGQKFLQDGIPLEKAVKKGAQGAGTRKTRSQVREVLKSENGIDKLCNEYVASLEHGVLVDKKIVRSILEEVYPHYPDLVHDKNSPLIAYLTSLDSKDSNGFKGRQYELEKVLEFFRKGERNFQVNKRIQGREFDMVIGGVVREFKDMNFNRDLDELKKKLGEQKHIAALLNKRFEFYSKRILPDHFKAWLTKMDILFFEDSK